ncbi:Os12g0237801 [Oryza sativa Japonica Group]|uniref:Os12g0237801 protein n=1 Tax=Oryza sativa subsp. japonica TaxID=39947 RepID=A0A0P0Y8G3_ORYSJ|nr:Os12g0237801 [Oryza sativa Japonica Group]
MPQDPHTQASSVDIVVPELYQPARHREPPCHWIRRRLSFIARPHAQPCSTGPPTSLSAAGSATQVPPYCWIGCPHASHRRIHSRVPSCSRIRRLRTSHRRIHRLDASSLPHPLPTSRPTVGSAVNKPLVSIIVVVITTAAITISESTEEKLKKGG